MKTTNKKPAAKATTTRRTAVKVGDMRKFGDRAIGESPQTASMMQGFSSAFGQSLSRTQAGFINSVSSESADRLLVGMMANQTEAKLQQNRANGKYGWHTENCSSDQLRADLKALVAKGDYIDAAIVAGMLLLRDQMGLS